jgi:predicted GNAT family acetyltransferase
MTNTVRDNTERQRFELDADGHIAFADYKRAGGLLSMLHTEVPKALEGRGIGSALIRGVLNIARSEGLKVNPLCPLRKGLHRKASGIRRPAPVTTCES